MPLPTASEFGFELRVCGWAERWWPPATNTAAPVIVARQLGTAQRRWDTIVIEVDPQGLRRRLAFGERRINGNLLHVVKHAPADWAFYRDALPKPEYPWRYVREAIHTGAEQGVIESRKRGGRIEIKRIAPYPSWVRRVIAIENKPDLDASAARALQDQLQHDVAIGLADEVWLATAATGEPVEPALLERIPVEVGILALDTGGADVIWHPSTLDPDATGTAILERPSGEGFDQSASRFEYRPPDEKARTRLEIAERAYERGWRSYVDSMRPDCRHFDLNHGAFGFVPTCIAKDREQTPAECGSKCPAVEPEPPVWRQKNWPVNGGPGKAVQRLLEERRKWRRQVSSGEVTTMSDRGSESR